MPADSGSKRWGATQLGHRHGAASINGRTPGIGHVAVGMHRQGFDLQLTQYDERGWRATFYTTGMEHSPTSATGTAWESTPWRATQRAARDALRKVDAGD